MPESSVFCSQCGAQNLPGGTFCQKCGAGLASVLSAAASGTGAAAAYTPAAPADWSAYGGAWSWRFWLMFVGSDPYAGFVFAPLPFSLFQRLLTIQQAQIDDGSHLVYRLWSCIFNPI